MENKILVTGAAGSIGTKAVKRLLNLQLPVRALVRKTDARSDALAALGAEIVIGDVTDFMSVSAAMKGIAQVLFIYPVAEGVLEGTAYIAQAAFEENVEAIVNISQRTSARNASSSFAQSQWLAERVLSRSGVATTHLQPTLFMDWMLYFAKEIKENDRYISPFGEAIYGTIDSGDIAAVAAAVLANPAKHSGQTYQIYGPAEVSGYDVAETLSAVLQRKIAYANIPPDAFGDILKTNGLPPYQVKHIIGAANMFRSGEFRGMNDNVEKLTGSKPLSVKDFIVKNIGLFQ